ncbi:MAG: methylmalonyl-CoA carboxyltransferase [Candidatus Muiribacterium halophilum]|uniref:Methylmalonyl-CoA carboxyltransferase n=1 Tax=Muiribacterium halophilum TaxID=2053465 RepID=A0A2N5ZEK4_MUIH1|nr:MAG: methylmalonyl-CoA carboxyltransferase [Candidatus Muirbacterium halophilum]
MGNRTISEKIKEYQQKVETIKKGGGEKRIEKQHSLGKLTARERIDSIFDPNSFQELFMFSKHRCNFMGMEKKELPADGVITGCGEVNGRTVYAYSQDFTVSGGAAGEIHEKKICEIMDMAIKCGVPFIGINDGGGARIQEGVDALSGYGQIFFRNTLLSGVVPQISIIAGPCAGGAAYSPALTDFVIMVKNSAQMFITGPSVLKAVTGEEISTQALGGAMTHAKLSGVCHFVAENDYDAMNITKKLLSYLPSNNLEEPPVFKTDESTLRRDETLNNILPDDAKQPYNIKDIIKKVVDNGKFLEVQEFYAPNIVIGFARINGRSIGIVANQPAHMAGVLDINTSDKSSRFIRFCNCFNIPIVTFVDVPGFLPGVDQEYDGIIRHGAKMLFAYSAAIVPKITLIVRKAYGGAYLAMCSKDMGADRVIAWPTAEIAVMGAEGAAKIIFRKEINEAEDKEAKFQEKVNEYKKNFANPYVAAAHNYIDEIIEPAETRRHIIRALESIIKKRDIRPPKKHGNMPL